MNTDRYVIRVVVVTVAVLAAMCLATMCALALRHDAVPPELKEAFLLLAGAFIGLLARTSTPADDAPQQVTVVTEPAGPMAVDPSGTGPPPVPLN